MTKHTRRWPFMATPAAFVATVPTGAGALSDDGGATWVIADGTGRYLRAFFDGMPDWAGLRVNARRYSHTEAADALRRLDCAGVQAEAVQS